MRKSNWFTPGVSILAVSAAALPAFGQASQIVGRVDNNGELASDMNTAGNGSSPLGVNAPFNWNWDANTAGVGRGTIYVTGSSANGFVVKGETEPQSTEATAVPDGHGLLLGGGATGAGFSQIYQNINSVAGRHYWFVGSTRVNTGNANEIPNWGLTNGSSSGLAFSPPTGNFSYGTNVGRNSNLHHGMVATGNTITAQVGIRSLAAGANANIWFDGIRVIESNINVYSSLQNGNAETTPTQVTNTWDPSGIYGSSGVRHEYMFDGWLPMGGAVGNVMQIQGDVGTGKGGTGRSITLDTNNAWGRSYQFQRVKLGSLFSGTYSFSADVQSFGAVADARIGIDPTGGLDPSSANIIWSSAATAFGSAASNLAQWQTLTIGAAATDPSVGVTVWLAAGYNGPNASSAATAGARFDNMGLIPEPTTIGLLGLASLLVFRRRRTA